MARGELLRKLFLSHSRGEYDKFREIALQIVAEEKSKNNHQLANDLLRILENGSNGFHNNIINADFNSLPKDRERQAILLDIRHPISRFSEIVLKPDAERRINRIIDEYRKAEILKTHGLLPKTKILFCGPPGCGKTLCAEVVANELGLPILYTRFDAIVSSYLGETSANLRKVFDYAASSRWVVLFDEFDAIGKERDDENEHGELKRVVNSFLQLLDGFKSSSIIIAATNHEKLLDPALWRRFDEIVNFSLPTTHEIRSLIRMKLKNFPHKNIDIDNQASKLKGMSHSDVEMICFEAIKTCIITYEDSISQKIFDEAIAVQKDRLNIKKKASSQRKTQNPNQ